MTTRLLQTVAWKFIHLPFPSFGPTVPNPDDLSPPCPVDYVGLGSVSEHSLQFCVLKLMGNYYFYPWADCWEPGSNLGKKQLQFSGREIGEMLEAASLEVSRAKRKVCIWKWRPLFQ